MKFFAISILFASSIASAGSCCLGTGPKSFVQLRHLQNYELGIATSLRDTYGRYDSYGSLVNAETNQSYQLSLGASVRATPRMEAYAILPFVSQRKGYVGAVSQSTNLGDILIGTRVDVFDTLFEDEWLPNIKLIASVKIPSGSVDLIETTGRIRPGTGNGIWEPSLGVSLTKDYSSAIMGFSGAYTRRFAKTVRDPIRQTSISVKEGDRIELTESITVPITTRFSAGGGLSQAWDMDQQVEGNAIADSSGRVMSAFINANYFVTRFVNIGAGFEAALPVEKFGANQEAFRSFTASMTYAIY